MPGWGVIDGLLDTVVVIAEIAGVLVGAGAATVVSVAAGAAPVVSVAAGATVVAVASLAIAEVAVAAGAGAGTEVAVGVSPPQPASRVPSSTKLVVNCKSL
jgi:hypothetical protein